MENFVTVIRLGKYVSAHTPSRHGLRQSNNLDFAMLALTDFSNQGTR
jgi:hypothetical protein